MRTQRRLSGGARGRRQSLRQAISPEVSKRVLDQDKRLKASEVGLSGEDIARLLEKKQDITDQDIIEAAIDKRTQEIQTQGVNEKTARDIAEGLLRSKQGFTSVGDELAASGKSAELLIESEKVQKQKEIAEELQKQGIPKQTAEDIAKKNIRLFGQENIFEKQFSMLDVGGKVEVGSEKAIRALAEDIKEGSSGSVLSSIQKQSLFSPITTTYQDIVRYDVEQKQKQKAISDIIKGSKVPSDTGVPSILQKAKKDKYKESLESFKTEGKVQEFYSNIILQIDKIQAENIAISQEITEPTKVQFELLSKQETVSPMQMQDVFMSQEGKQSFKDELKMVGAVGIGTAGLVGLGTLEAGVGLTLFGIEAINNPSQAAINLVNVPSQIKGAAQRILREPVSGVTSVGLTALAFGKMFKAGGSVLRSGLELRTPTVVTEGSVFTVELPKIAKTFADVPLLNRLTSERMNIKPVKVPESISMQGEVIGFAFDETLKIVDIPSAVSGKKLTPREPTLIREYGKSEGVDVSRFTFPESGEIITTLTKGNKQTTIRQRLGKSYADVSTSLFDKKGNIIKFDKAAVTIKKPQLSELSVRFIEETQKGNVIKQPRESIIKTDFFNIPIIEQGEALQVNSLTKVKDVSLGSESLFKETEARQTIFQKSVIKRKTQATMNFETTKQVLDIFDKPKGKATTYSELDPFMQISGVKGVFFPKTNEISLGYEKGAYGRFQPLDISKQAFGDVGIHEAGHKISLTRDLSRRIENNPLARDEFFDVALDRYRQQERYLQKGLTSDSIIEETRADLIRDFLKEPEELKSSFPNIFKEIDYITKRQKATLERPIRTKATKPNLELQGKDIILSEDVARTLKSKKLLEGDTDIILSEKQKVKLPREIIDEQQRIRITFKTDIVTRPKKIKIDVGRVDLAAPFRGKKASSGLRRLKSGSIVEIEPETAEVKRRIRGITKNDFVEFDIQLQNELVRPLEQKVKPFALSVAGSRQNERKIVRPVIKPISRLSDKSISRLSDKSIFKSLQIPLDKTISKSIQKPIEKVAQKPIQQPLTKQTQELESKQTFMDINITPPPIHQPITPPPVETMFSFPLFDKLGQFKQVQGYNAIIRERGRRLKANIKPLPKKQAELLVKDVLDNSLSASGMIARAKGKVPLARRRILSTGNTIDDKEFRMGRTAKTKGMIVEKRKYRLDSPGERNEIKASKLISTLKKSSKMLKMGFGKVRL